MHGTLLTKKNGVISHFLDAQIAQKVMSMGIMPGTEIKVIRSAPWFGSYYVKCGRKILALRKGEIEKIVVI